LARVGVCSFTHVVGSCSKRSQSEFTSGYD